jgi:hypothetical protein
MCGNRAKHGPRPHRRAVRTRQAARRLPAIVVALALVALVGTRAQADGDGLDFGPPRSSSPWSPSASAAWSPRVSEAWSPQTSAAWSPGASEVWAPDLSSSWSPDQSSDWAPRVAERITQQSLPTPGALEDSEWIADSSSELANDYFGVPPLDASLGQPAFPQPYGCGPPCNGWQVQSHFQPMLCRFGLIAPRAPGVESMHSSFLAGGPACGCGPRPAIGCELFAPPPCGAEAATSDGSCNQLPTLIDPRSGETSYHGEDFTTDPFYDQIPWDSCLEGSVYGDKYLNPVQRPLVECGMPLYLNGPVPPPTLEFGPTNPSLKRFYVYGDYRAAAAYNAQNGSDKGVLANRLNLELDYWLTATERFHGFIGPLQEGNDFLGYTFDDGDADFVEALDFWDEDTDTLFFEGDIGAMMGGFTGTYSPFDMPIAVGVIPLLFQNGVWMEDAILGMAVTIPARNSPFMDWSNYDVTFFYGTNYLNSPAFGQNDSADVIGATTFIEAKGGYLEAGYARLEDPTWLGRSYHNIGVSYTRRYLNLVSNSVRVIGNVGQEGPVSDRTANGVLFIVENSFLTPQPYNVIPYVNMWVGIDDPQSVARAGAAGGVLRNTGILFESDNLTGYPTLDATANDTYGAAVGLDLLAPDFTQQLILEAAVLQVFGDPADRNAPGDQYGIGARYQIPISYRFLIRCDAMHGWLENTHDVTGARVEFRWKF